MELGGLQTGPTARNGILGALHPSYFGADAHLTSIRDVAGLVDACTIGAYDAFAQNQNEINTSLQWKEFGYDAALTTLTAGGGSLPGVGPISGDMIDKVGGSLRDEVIGIMNPIDASDPINDLSAQAAGNRILATIAATGGDTHLRPASYENGELFGYPPDANAVVVDARSLPAGRLSRRPSGGDRAGGLGMRSGRQLKTPAEGMVATYNGVTKNPNPHG